MEKTLRLLTLVTLATAAACGGDEAPTHTVTLVGQAYDGATGERLVGYNIQVTYADRTLTGVVDGMGRFLVKDLPVYQDYTVEITATDKRPFRSHNMMFFPPALAGTAAFESSVQTFYFDAYLFSAGLVVPPPDLTVRLGTSTGDPASGKVRIRPSAQSILADSAIDQPAGVPGQVWTNDEDLQAPPINRDFTDGTIVINAGELVYGVRYQISIYGVDGYQPLEAFLTAGVDGTKTYVLPEETSDPLLLVQSNAGSCARPTSPTDTMASTVTFEFTRDIELAMTTYPGGFAEEIDDQFQMNSISNGDGNFNTLAVDVSPDVRERGTSLTISGRMLTVSWNASVGLATKDPADIISYARWNVGGVEIQPVGKPTQKVSLGVLLPGSTNIICSS